MITLGIHDGHNACAALLRDGRLVSCISEERLSRVKNDAGYPRRAVEGVLAAGGVDPREVDAVVLGTRFLHRREFYLQWDWYRRGYDEQIKDSGIDAEKLTYFERRAQERRAAVSSHLGISDAKLSFLEHHTGHAATAYFGSGWASSGPSLVMTLDGSGDGVCSTVSIGERGRLTRIAQTTRDASVGKVYSRLTYLLGMKPWEHEYKLMGLAPYAETHAVAVARKVIDPLVRLADSGLSFECGTKLSTNYCYPYLREGLEGCRFDAIAGAVQELTEDLVLRWVENAVRHTGIRRVACAGGVFMNVKANLRVLMSPMVDELFVFPSCGDESIAIGAAYHAQADGDLAQGRCPKIEPLQTLYLGETVTERSVDRAIECDRARDSYTVSEPASMSEAIADLLADGNIVARFAGPMEWGARALGNRSILMDPRRTSSVPELNAAIKHRDFWMPFAPTVLAEHQHDYLTNPKNAESRFMILSFPTTAAGSQDLAAAVHPYDRSARPQILERQMNAEYYEVIAKFKQRTGVSALLNTSFNLHGEPIVCNPEDALSVFSRSGLLFLAFPHVILSKRDNAHGSSVRPSSGQP